MNTNSTEAAEPFEGWTMGATSSCLNDIANDDFAQILHIEGAKDEEHGTDTDDDKCDYDESIHNERMPMLQSNTLQVPRIRTSLSDSSILSALHFADSTANSSNENAFLTVPSAGTPSMSVIKNAGSDVSISFFLDRDDAGEAFDEYTFANVNSNTLLEPTRKKSNVNVTFLLDEED